VLSKSKHAFSRNSNISSLQSRSTKGKERPALASVTNFVVETHRSYGLQSKTPCLTMASANREATTPSSLLSTNSNDTPIDSQATHLNSPMGEDYNRQNETDDEPSKENDKENDDYANDEDANSEKFATVPDSYPPRNSRPYIVADNPPQTQP
jgi:hypothetical protein